MKTGTPSVALDRDVLVAALAHLTPRETNEVAATLQKRSPDHAAVLHDSLYFAATQRRSRSAPVRSPVRAAARSKARGSLKGRLRRLAARAA